MAKSKRQKQRSTQQTPRPATSQSASRKTASTRQPSRRSITAAAQQAERRRELMQWLGMGLLLAVVAVGALIYVNSRDDESGSNADPASVVAADPLPAGIEQNGTVLGDPNAPIVIVEYGDYQCPFCKRFAINDYPTLIQEYVTTGKVRLEYKQFPIIGSNSDGSYDQSGESFKAAEAAYCANDQGKFWPMHDLLYENSLGEFKGSFSVERIKRIAGLVDGLDTAAFNTCLDSGTHTQTVLDSASDAVTNGISSTPSFLVNGQLVRGADYAGLKSVIESKLADQ
jgi:protein-disulfide isomerase